ncbi:MAG: hypothetical protein GXP49_07165 [Deltaproteobacteria bacterium]|nr:hypothetical protein [Deltaproteobacteria bacterium]
MACFSRYFCLALLCSCFYSHRLSATEIGFDFDAYLGARVSLDRGGQGLYQYPDSRGATTELSPYFSVYPSLSMDADISDTLEILARWEPGELAYSDSKLTLGGRKPLNILREEWGFRELKARLHSGSGIELTLGKQDLELAHGLIYDNAGLGMTMVIGPTDTGDMLISFESWAVFPDGAFMPYRTEQGYECNFETGNCTSGDMRIPSKKSWLVSSLLRLEPSPFESVEIFGAVFSDRGGEFNSLLKPMLEEQAMVGLAQHPYLKDIAVMYLEGNQEPSRGDMLYLGASGKQVLGFGVLRYSLVMGAGAIEIHLPKLVRGPKLVTVKARTKVTGYALDFSAEFPLFEWLGITPFFTFMSGDTGAFSAKGTENLGVFIAPSARVYRTNLFFEGGLNQSYLTRQATAAGLAGKGVVAGGLSLEASFFEELDLDVKAAALGAHRPSAITGGRYYGTELDVELHYSPIPGLELGLETDLLVEGRFLEKPANVFRVMLGMDWNL